MSEVTDSERTRAAAGKAIDGALMCICGVVLVRLSGVAVEIGAVLLLLGVTGVAHAELLGLGFAGLPDSLHGRGRDD